MGEALDKFRTIIFHPVTRTIGQVILAALVIWGAIIVAGGLFYWVDWNEVIRGIAGLLAFPLIDPYEVDAVFETPLSFLMNPENHVRRKAMWKGRERVYLEMPHNGRYIWGVTAGVIRALYDRLYPEWGKED